ncbi:hypothetical protein F896_02554 [Acinetobacter genomosp. 15BJ]|uniref:Uncharacterized protein n=1 Tax=Acinetobacter genomosp. 15BJ TaxID=106651 RepID=R9B116_9GAMM|nr:hypothetical protein F896_02554 [Acinetobacter genomosp. 15BJ]
MRPDYLSHLDGVVCNFLDHFIKESLINIVNLK